MADGWNVKVCADRTEATGVRLQIGLGGDDRTHQDWTTWRSGEPAIIEAPVGFKRVAEIWIKGISLDRGRNVNMCIRFNDDNVKRMEFDNEEEHEKHQDDRDDCDC
jgi:hypothetical protein